MLYPISAIGFSCIFNFFKIFDKIGKQAIYLSCYSWFLICGILLCIKPSKIVFILLSLNTGYWTVMLYTVPYMLVSKTEKKLENVSNPCPGYQGCPGAKISRLRLSIYRNMIFLEIELRVSWVDNLLVIFQVDFTAGFFRNFIFLHFYMT